MVYSNLYFTFFPFQFPCAKGETYQVLQSKLSAAAASLNIASNELVSGSHGTPEQLAIVSADIATKFQELLIVSNIVFIAKDK